MIFKKIRRKFKKAKKILSGKNGFRKLCSKIGYKLFSSPAIKIAKKKITVSKDNYIVMESRPDYADNVRVLAEYMVNNGYLDRYKVFILVDNPKKYKEYEVKGFKFVRKFGKYHRHRTFKAYYYTLKSKYVVFTHACRWVDCKTTNQLYINLWHGCGYKDARGEEGLTNVFDYVLVPGPVFIESKSRFFGCEPEKVIPIGYPRYDMFKTENPRMDEFFERFNPGAKNVVWMPTFRDKEQLLNYKDPIPFILGLPLTHSINDFYKIDEICRKENINLIVKSHRNTNGGSGVNKEYTNIFYVENSDLAELDIKLYQFVAKTDALITDYSSIAIDYLLLNKPIAFTVDDIEDYGGTRGFVFEDPKKYMGGEFVNNIDELAKFLHDVSIGADPTAVRREAIMGDTQNPTENYCKRVLDYFGIE